MSIVKTAEILLVASIVISPGRFLRGAAPEFRFDFDGCPAIVEGIPGQVVAVSVGCTLTTSNNTSSEGARQWVFSIAFEGASYMDARLAGIVVSTVYDEDAADPINPPTDPYFLDLKNASGLYIARGYEAEVHSRPAGDVCVGVVGYVILFEGYNRRGWLQPTGTQVIAKITVEVQVPEPGSEKDVRLEYRDGLFGQGPVAASNFAVFQGSDINASLGECRFTVKAKEQGGLRIPGDANGDGLLDISDAVVTLTILFLGGDKVFPCGDGSATNPANVKLIDWQPDITVDISDAVAMLSFLFLGSSPHTLAPQVDADGCVRIVGCTDFCGQ